MTRSKSHCTAGVGRLLAALLLPLSATALAAQAAGEPQPITIEEAVRLARRNAPAAVQARGQTRTARAGEQRSLSAFFPSVSVSASTDKRSAGVRFDQEGRAIVTPTPQQYSTGLNANVELFSGGRRLFGVRQARAVSDAAAANETSTRFQVALDVSEQFYASLAALESEAAARAQLEQAEAQLRAAVSRMRAGAATKSDSLRSVIQVGNAQLALLTAQNSRRVADAALTRIIGSPVPVTADARDSVLPPIELDSTTLIRLAEEGPAVRQAEADLEAARAGRRVAFAPYLPTVSASYSRGGSGPGQFGLGDDIYTYSNTLRFSLSYPLFNQWQCEEQQVRASVAEDNAEAELRDARALARQTLVQQLGALRTAEQRMTIQAASVAAAEEDLRVQQQRYSLGASTLLDMLTSQSQLDQARAALIAARRDYRIARAQLEALIGREL